MHTNAIQNGRAIACLQGMLGYLDVKGGIPVPLSFSVMLDDKITLWDSQKYRAVPSCSRSAARSIRGTSRSAGRTTRTRCSTPSSRASRVPSRYIAIANDPLLCYDKTTSTTRP